MAANLALNGVFHGAEHIPDAVFEKAPYVGPRYFQPKDRDQNQQDSDSASNDESSRRSRRRSRRERRSTDNQKSQRGYDSDQGAAAPTHVPTAGNGAPPSVFIPPPYNPALYGANPGTRDAYFAGHPQEQQPAQYQPQTPLPQQTDQEARRHSVAAERYRPANYDTYKRETHARNNSPGRSRRNSSYGGSPQPQALMVKPPQPGTLYPEYKPPEWGDADDRERRDGSRSRRDSRSKSRTGSRVREELKKHKDMASTSLGVLAGGIIGNEITSRKGHSSTMGLVGGAILGGLAGHVLEKGYEKEKKKKGERRRRYSDSYDEY